jgi:hypothetical protein
MGRVRRWAERDRREREGPVASNRVLGRNQIGFSLFYPGLFCYGTQTFAFKLASL